MNKQAMWERNEERITALKAYKEGDYETVAEYLARCRESGVFKCEGIDTER